MRPKFLLLAFLILPLLTAQAQHDFRVLHAFGSGNDGAGVWDSVTLDARGNVYGTTSGRGLYGGGVVFRLAPGLHARWKETILHAFPSSRDDGGGPFGGVLLGASGTLYGTTQSLGAHDRGVAFSLTPNNGRWKERILHSFCSKRNCDDGGVPWGNLIAGPNGSLFGTGYVAFELTPDAKNWTDITLHDFTGNNGDGSGPQAGPMRDAVGNLYGTTGYGGGGPWCAPDGCGVVWELSPPAGSVTHRWTEHILYRFGFSRTDGDTPSLGQLARDPEGNLYGAAGGGEYKAGLVYRVTPTAGVLGDTWRTTILYNFTGGADGDSPGGGVIVDNAGNLYGTTIAGGSSNCGCGVVFKLSPQTDGSWKYTLLHTFVGSDGAQPDANLALGPDGKLYGTAATGGANGGGVVFQLTP
jgi:uncharacterized repeat protein (TIGR03803 family)